MGKLLVIVGLLIAGIGLLVWWGIPIGRLPGDIVIRRGNFTLYVPIVNGILLSLVLTVLVSILRRWSECSTFFPRRAAAFASAGRD